MDETVTERARRLRREATRAERALWFYLRKKQILGAKFRRQHRIGNFFADFCCIEARLVVEVDSESHSNAEAHDGLRSQMLAREGYRVIRFRDTAVMSDMDGVLADIRRVLEERLR